MRASIILILLAWIPTSAFAASVTAPCTKSKDPGLLRSCSEVLDGPTGTLELLKKRVKTQIDGDPSTQAKGYYQEVDPNITPSPGTYFGPTLCNLIKTEFNTEETTADHHGKSCGKSVDFEVHAHWEHGGGCLTDGSVTIIPLKRWKSGPPEAEGTLEDGYFRGGLVAATNCYYQAIKNEIKTSQALQIFSNSGCSALADDLQGIQSSFKQTSNSIQKEIEANPNSKDINTCAVDKFSGNEGEVGPLKQAVQHLCAARMGSEGLFNQLAACEVFARASQSWLTEMGSSEKQKIWIERLSVKVGRACGDECKEVVKANTSHMSECYYDDPSANDIRDCALRCYRSKLPGFIKTEIERRWPADGSKCKEVL